ncbi:MAG: ThiF family adenylyltransferase, partial [Pseudomonadales bacterium]|nr:ThiF family adenylyltransferase [Pseudomonadales bacterium]
LLADDDEVDLSNLQRQIAHHTDSIGQAKTASAAERIKAINPNVEVTQITERFSAESLSDFLHDIDLVVDCTDNFNTRFAINRVCLDTGTPLVSGAAIRLEGQVMVVDPRIPDAPCYQCLYKQGDDSNLNCAENGVAAPVVGIIGTIQAMEAMKLIAGFGQTLAGYLLVFDARNMEFRKLKLPKDPHCACCGTPAS